MYHLTVVVTVLLCFLQAQGADKYTDENRPYEFGFTIDGEQHRHEKKDENGLIMGEFGFITADGVYHVTVYATDENGNFKILSMKNLRVKPYPTAPARKGNSLPFPPSSGAGAQAPGPQPPVQQEPVSLEPPIKSCSHCSIPTTPKPPNPNEYEQAYNPQYPDNAQNPQYPEYPQYPPLGQDDSQQNYPNPPGAQQYPEQNLQSGERNPKQYEVSSQYPQEGSGPTKPVLISAQMQIVDKNTDIYQRGPGEREGLPNGLSKGDMEQLLYTFNYTVGFHGHHEEGYRNGAKKGYYYVTGRNGVRTRVDYVADEKGFRPKITQEVLDLLSDDVPKAETERDEKYGLKGYEFKWLYYPVDSKRR